LTYNQILVPFNNLSQGWIANSAEVEEAVIRVIRSGKFIQGPEHDNFELELSSYLGVQFVLGVANGTEALQLALLALGCDESSTIIVAPNAGGYGSICARQIGAKVIYCDVDPNTALITAELLEPILSEQIKAVVVTHLYGNIVEIERIVELCHDRGIFVVEDCAQALGGTFNGKRIGSFGDVAAISFYPTKNLGGAGDGGAVATSNKSIADKIRALRQYGWSEKYRIDLDKGINSRLDEVQAAILRIGLRNLDQINDVRRRIISEYKKCLHDSEIVLISSDSSNSAPHLAVLRLPIYINRELFRNMLRSKGIESAIHFPIVDMDQSGFSIFGSQSRAINAISLSGQIISIPCYAEMTPRQVSIVSEAISTENEDLSM
jgi:dTDP-4-amino-4,6-dideoxygalactose transaminase